MSKTWLDLFGHEPVLLSEVRKFLQVKTGGCYMDCTVGTGAAAYSILKESAPNSHLIGIDRDPSAIALTKKNLADYHDRVTLFHGNFSHLRRFVASSGFVNVDGVLFDFGLSSVQLRKKERGFSFMADGPLDMRMDPSSGQTAEEWLANCSEKDIEETLRTDGEERFSRRIAQAIVKARSLQPIQTTADLVEIIRQAVPSWYHHRRIHYATRTFQAIRIAVNQELDGIEEALCDAISLLRPGGRLCAIAFHSLEDRLVKQTFKKLAQQPHPLVTILTKKPCVPSVEERRANPRSRSAKLRVVERWTEGVMA